MDIPILNKFLDSHRGFVLLAARLLVGIFFLLAGVQKLGNIEGVAGYIGSVGLPMGTLLAYAAAVFLIVAGGALIFGYYMRYAAFLLALYVILVTLLFHGPQLWADDPSGANQLAFMKNIAILGGLLYMSVYSK